MSLPSKYAPGGLSLSDQSRTITVKSELSKSAANYTVKTIENRISEAIENQKHIEHNTNEDIEMIPIDDDSEVNMISNFVNDRRNNGNFLYDDSMDIVENSKDTSYTENTSYLIIDTNFMLSHLNILDELKNIGEKYCLQLIVPVTVMKELDGLKKSDREINNSIADKLSNKSVGHLARWANDWIYSVLAKNSPVVRGQKLRQIIDKNATQDDAILDCCLYFKDNYPNSLVVLLSNDKNLCLKCLTDEILTVSFRKGMTAEFIAKTIQSENIHRFGQIVNPSPQNLSLAYNSNVKIPETSSNYENESLSQKIYDEVQVLVLSAIHHCMENTYGEDLELLKDYNKNDVVSLRDGSEVLIRFWFPVFQAYFDISYGKFKPFEEVKEGRKSIKSALYIDIPNGKNKLNEFISYWSKVLTALYHAEMDARQNDALEILINRWRQKAKESV